MLIETTVLYGLHCICAIKAGQNTCNICLQLFYTLILDNLQIEHSPTEAYICSTSKFHLKPKYNKHQLQMIQVQRGQNTHSPAEMSRAGEDRAPGAQNPDFHSEFRSTEGFSILFPRSAKVFGAQVKIVNPFCTTFS